MLQTRDTIIGCIIGGAVGDYWGVPYEGLLGPVEARFPARSQLSDDTQLTLATCEAIVEAGRADPATIAGKMAEWYAAGRITGIGSSTLKAMRDLCLGAPWTISGATGEMSAGNGAAMRIAPVAFCCDPRSDTGRMRLRDVSSITHRHDEAFAGALAVALAITHPGTDYLDDVISELPDSNCRDKLVALADEPDDADLTELGLRYGVSGYVADTVPIAVYAASRIGKRSFHDILRSLIACGGDTDTIGSIAGQIMGSKIGSVAIPEELSAAIPGLKKVRMLAGEFAKAAMGLQTHPGR